MTIFAPMLCSASRLLLGLTLAAGFLISGAHALPDLVKSTSIKGPPKVVVIPVEEQVDFGLLAYLRRSIKEAEAKNPDILVFKVNTYGGELQSAFDIVDLLMGITKCSTYAYVEQKAISAGALISLANNRIAMGKGTTIGDCAPITQGEGGIVMLGEKIQSPLRAKFRTLAEKNGYPTLMTEAMVTADMGVVAALPADAPKTKAPGPKPWKFFTGKQWENLDEKEKKAFSTHKVIAAEGQLLTITDQEAAEYGLSQGSYGSIDEFIKDRGWEKIGETATTWSEDMVRFIGTLAPVLMLIGFGALYMEFKTPGISIFGLVGIICLSIVFGSKYAVGLADHTELLLLLGGFALFMAEIYLFPGTFIAGALGLLLMLAALSLSFQSFTVPDPEMPWEMQDMLDNLALTFGMAAAAIVIPFAAVRFLGDRLPARGGIISAATLAGARVESAEVALTSVGMPGIAKTPLRPTGKALLDGHTLEVSSRGEFIEAGAEVEVFRIDGNTIVVRPRGKAA